MILIEEAKARLTGKESEGHITFHSNAKLNQRILVLH
jgi:hypothetical protein